MTATHVASLASKHDRLPALPLSLCFHSPLARQCCSSAHRQKNPWCVCAPTRQQCLMSVAPMPNERRRLPCLSASDVQRRHSYAHSTQQEHYTVVLYSETEMQPLDQHILPPAQMQQTLGITQQPLSSGTWVQQPTHPDLSLDPGSPLCICLYESLAAARGPHARKHPDPHPGLPSDSGQIRLRHQRAVCKLEHQLPPVARGLRHTDAHGRLVEDRKSYRAIPRRHGLLLLIQHVLRAEAGFAAGADAGGLQRRGPRWRRPVRRLRACLSGRRAPQCRTWARKR